MVDAKHHCIEVVSSTTAKGRVAMFLPIVLNLAVCDVLFGCAPAGFYVRGRAHDVLDAGEPHLFFQVQVALVVHPVGGGAGLCAHCEVVHMLGGILYGLEAQIVKSPDTSSPRVLIDSCIFLQASIDQRVAMDLDLTLDEIAVCLQRLEQFTWFLHSKAAAKVSLFFEAFSMRNVGALMIMRALLSHCKE